MEGFLSMAYSETSLEWISPHFDDFVFASSVFLLRLGWSPPNSYSYMLRMTPVEKELAWLNSNPAITDECASSMSKEPDGKWVGRSDLGSTVERSNVK